MLKRIKAPIAYIEALYDFEKADHAKTSKMCQMYRELAESSLAVEFGLHNVDSTFAMIHEKTLDVLRAAVRGMLLGKQALRRFLTYTAGEPLLPDEIDKFNRLISDVDYTLWKCDIAEYEHQHVHDRLKRKLVSISELTTRNLEHLAQLDLDCKSDILDVEAIRREIDAMHHIDDVSSHFYKDGHFVWPDYKVNIHGSENLDIPPGKLSGKRTHPLPKRQNEDDRPWTPEDVFHPTDEELAIIREEEDALLAAEKAAKEEWPTPAEAQGAVPKQKATSTNRVRTVSVNPLPPKAATPEPEKDANNPTPETPEEWLTIKGSLVLNPFPDQKPVAPVSAKATDDKTDNAKATDDKTDNAKATDDGSTSANSSFEAVPDPYGPRGAEESAEAYIDRILAPRNQNESADAYAERLCRALHFGRAIFPGDEEDEDPIVGVLRGQHGRLPVRRSFYQREIADTLKRGPTEEIRAYLDRLEDLADALLSRPARIAEQTADKATMEEKAAGKATMEEKAQRRSRSVTPDDDPPRLADHPDTIKFNARSTDPYEDVRISATSPSDSEEENYEEPY